MNDEIREILDGFKEILVNPTTTDECYDGRIIEIDRSYDLEQDEIKILLDYIINLQKENERLKEENKHIFANVNDDELLISNAMNYAEAQDYKSRVEKAVEYINKYEVCLIKNGIPEISRTHLLNILQNGSGEE